MAPQFHRLRILDVTHETPDAVSIAFEIPSELLQEFTYKPGQYLTVKVPHNDSTQRRAYSLCSTPFSVPSYPIEPLRIAVKRVSGGIVSNYLNTSVRAGDIIDVMPPMGNFHADITPSLARHYVLFAGGSGITPIFSILKSVLFAEPESRVTLFYGNRNEESIIFKKVIEKLQLDFPSRLRVFHVLETPSERMNTGVGRMDKSTVLSLLGELSTNEIASSEYFLCGPSVMMDEVQRALSEKNVAPTRIRREFFSSAVPDAINSKPAPIHVPTTSHDDDDENGSTNPTVEVTMYGKKMTVTIQNNETILDALIREDNDPPYACQIGSCCTCRAKVLSGKVVMDDREALTDDEIDEGYVLTCQARPVSSHLVVSYDE